MVCSTTNQKTLRTKKPTKVIEQIRSIATNNYITPTQKMGLFTRSWKKREFPETKNEKEENPDSILGMTSAKHAEKALLAKIFPKERSELDLESATMVSVGKGTKGCVCKFESFPSSSLWSPLENTQAKLSSSSVWKSEMYCYWFLVSEYSLIYCLVKFPWAGKVHLLC